MTFSSGTIWSFQSTSASLPTLTATTMSLYSIRQIDAALNFLGIFQRVFAELFLWDRLVEPRTPSWLLNSASSQIPSSTLIGKSCFANQLERRQLNFLWRRTGESAETVIDQDLQVFENLRFARIDRAVAAIRMLAFPETRIGNRHNLAGQQRASRSPASNVIALQRLRLSGTCRLIADRGA